ncbi:hypothetical protein JCM16161A_13430 [Vulcanisaeta sp. JCM 16161]|uniref:hypothetical protein n=1 Tax=Vulcanisaeta sp. JCM 16161 TaxID=1295372 RepID=UPI0006D17152|nr:hypothetical protein [Vulcanisaeta sp. JCM 16161]
MNRETTLILVVITTIIITITLSYILLPKTYVQVSIGKLTLSIPIPYSVLGVTVTAIAIAIELLPLSIIEYRLWRVNNEILMDMPTIIRIIRDGLSSGQSLSGVAETLTKAGKGRLGRIIAESIRKEIMGVATMREGLTKTSSELGNNYLAMLAAILDTAIKSGARLQETLDMAYKSFEDLVSYYLEKANQVKPYLALIYVVIAIYIILADVVIYLMMPSIGKITISTSTGAIAVPTLSMINVQLFSSIIMISSIIQSIIAGAIIGRIVYGKSTVGLLHASILIIITALINYLMYVIMYVHIV